MPKLRQEARRAASGVPVEFDDLNSPAWASADALARWLTAQGIPDRGSTAVASDAGPATRRKHAIEAWLHANGCASDRWPALLDWHRVADVQLPQGWQSASYLERLRSVTVKP